MSSARRRQQLQTEIELITGSLCSNQITKITWNEDDRNLCIIFPIKEITLTFNLYIPEDFPEIRPFCSVESSIDVVKILDLVNIECEKSKSTIQSIFNVLADELSKRFSISILKNHLESNKIINDLIEQQSILKISSNTIDRKWAKESSEFESEREMDDDQYMFDKDEDQDDHVIESPLMKHCKQVQLLFGEDSIMLHQEIHTVRFMLNTASIDPKLYSVLNITEHNQCVVVSVHFSSLYTDATEAPKVKVIHPQVEATTVKSGLGEQIENIVSHYLKNRWPLLHAESNNHPLHKLTTMGFDPQMALNALEGHHYDMELTAAYLFDKPKMTSLVVGSDKQQNHTNRQNPIMSPQLAIALALHHHSLDINDAYEELLNITEESSEISTILTNWPSATCSLARTKDNFVLELMVYLVRRIPSVMGHCLICDECIGVEGYEGFDPFSVPTICTKGTCLFNYIELNVCSSLPVAICPTSLAEDIRNNEDVVDLLISMCFSAVTSERRDIIFTPSPPDYPKNAFSEIVKVLELFPSVEDMIKHCNSEFSLIQYLLELDPEGNVYRLLRWILTVNRAALLKIPLKSQIPQMRTPNQYLMMSGGSPEKDIKFRQFRKQYGSFFAFHGSGIENWHSILRRGLLNCSDTSMMVNGAAHGSGIYCAANSQISFGYSRTGKGWSKSRFGDVAGLRCVAIVEVVKHPSVPKKPKPYYVIHNPAYVATRFFLFYPSGDPVATEAASLKLDQFISK